MSYEVSAVIGRKLLRIHRDERGAVSLETVLIIGAIAMPVLVFILKFGWPAVKKMFDGNTYQVDRAVENVKATGTPN